MRIPVSHVCMFVCSRVCFYRSLVCGVMMIPNSVRAPAHACLVLRAAPRVGAAHTITCALLLENHTLRNTQNTIRHHKSRLYVSKLMNETKPHRTNPRAWQTRVAHQQFQPLVGSVQHARVTRGERFAICTLLEMSARRLIRLTVASVVYFFKYMLVMLALDVCAAVLRLSCSSARVFVMLLAICCDVACGAGVSRATNYVYIRCVTLSGVDVYVARRALCSSNDALNTTETHSCSPAKCCCCSLSRRRVRAC